MSEQKPTIGRSVHVRTEGGCLPAVVTFVHTAEDLRVTVFALDETKPGVDASHSALQGWHWYTECPEKK
jgi:hypothetical protein